MAEAQNEGTLHPITWTIVGDYYKRLWRTYIIFMRDSCTLNNQQTYTKDKCCFLINIISYWIQCQI